MFAKKTSCISFMWFDCVKKVLSRIKLLVNNNNLLPKYKMIYVDKKTKQTKQKGYKPKYNKN